MIECTASHSDTERYLGICWEVADVERLIDSRPPVAGETCRERWRTRDSDDTVLSEAPGVLAILAEEYYEQGRHWEDYWNEREEWLDKGLSPQPGDPTA